MYLIFDPLNPRRVAVLYGKRVAFLRIGIQKNVLIPEFIFWSRTDSILALRTLADEVQSTATYDSFSMPTKYSLVGRLQCLSVMLGPWRRDPGPWVLGQDSLFLEQHGPRDPGAMRPGTRVPGLQSTCGCGCGWWRQIRRVVVR